MDGRLEYLAEIRIRELESEKEVLNRQLDRREKQLANLRTQAEALHRIGSILDLGPGADLTREAPARVEALAAHVERLREELRDRAVQAWCGCEHSACKRCRDDADTERVLAEKPTTSLARRDADLLDRMAVALCDDHIEYDAIEPDSAANWLHEEADEIRRQARESK